MLNKKDIVQEQKELRIILNEWDPIGGAPEDEYDCFRDPIISILHKNGKEEDVIKFISKHLEEHVGIESNKSESEEVAKKIMNWWINKISHSNQTKLK